MEVLKFSSENCSPCLALSVFLKKENLPVTEYIADESLELASKYRVRGVPTLIKLVEGKEVARITGFDVSLAVKVKELFNV